MPLFKLPTGVSQFWELMASELMIFYREDSVVSCKDFLGSTDLVGLVFASTDHDGAGDEE